ncbi:MAG TPA: NAD(+) synthase [Polyangiaceae bacterium]|nr:NAD(+) synthase [Polyangiaceae bacterium]
MRLIRIALASTNSTVGAVKSNVARMAELARAAVKDGATVVVLPEQAIGGYAPEDLVQWRAFVDAQWVALETFAKDTAELDALFAIGLAVADDHRVFNAAALVSGGMIHGLVPKEKLPFYNVFYEERCFARGVPNARSMLHGVPFGDLVFDTPFGVVALEVCEDIWSPDGPMRRRCYAGAELVLNLSASPFRVGVQETRREMISTRAADNQATVAYCNLFGGNDGLVFDGGGFVSQNGRTLLEAPRFCEGVAAVTVDLDRTRRLRTENTTFRHDRDEWAALETSRIEHVTVDTDPKSRAKLTFPFPPHKSFFLPGPEIAKPTARAAFCEELLDALATGVGDYFEKNAVFKTIGVALSGGRDSLLCLWLARRWIDRKYGKDAPKKAQEILRAFFMPSRYSSEETRVAAEAAAKELHAPFSTVSIDEAFERELVAIESMLQPGEKLTALARQNAQARVRAERMWTWANSASGLFLQTSNMSEKAVGYTTIGGDLEGALSVIANVPKTVVNYLLDYLLETTGSEAIRLTLKKAPSAELAENQEDEKDLMPFPVLDACFLLYAGEKMSAGEVKAGLAAMFPEHAGKTDAWADRFGRLFTASIYKWVQAPLALHVGNLDLDRERALQLPVVQKTEW